MLPLATATVTIDRPVAASDPDDEATMQRLFSAMRATISSPGGDMVRASGAQEVVDAVLYAGVTDPALVAGDWVTDVVTGDRWRISWVRRRHGLGLDHQQAALRAVAGSVVG